MGKSLPIPISLKYVLLLATCAFATRNKLAYKAREQCIDFHLRWPDTAMLSFSESDSRLWNDGTFAKALIVTLPGRSE